MKTISKLSKLSLLVLAASACSSPNGHNLTGEIKGLGNDTILIFVNDPVNRKSVKIDTVPVVNNKFSIDVPDTSLVSLSIIEKPAGNGALRMASNAPFLLLPGEKMKISGDITNLQASGTEIYDNMSKAQDVLEIENELKVLNEKFIKAYQSKDEKQVDSLSNISKGLYEEYSKKKLEFIKNNPNSLVAGYLYTSMKSSDGAEAEKLLGENVKNGPLAGLIAKTTDNYNKQNAINKAKESIKAGMPAPDFKLKNLNNEEMTLSSFKGKYALLDFWGTWCGWCIKGMPDMKKYYAKYKDKLEIVGIDCRDTEKKWREGVEEHQLPWTNLYNDKNNDVTVKYAISGYPTKILIDPEGKIVDVFVGESEDLYKKLDEMFK